MSRSRQSRILRLVLPVLIAGTLVAGPVTQGAGSARAATLQAQAPARKWVSYNTATKTVNLTLIAAYGADTFNFNGGSNGQLRIKVPVGSKVVVRFSNMSPMMLHGAEVVRWTGTLPTGAPPTPAFAGAASPNYQHGTPHGVTQVFSFTASQAGKYLLICPVKNHVKFGHWAWFTVSNTATVPSVVLK